jgi:RNA-directed DNA polymerase
MQDRAMQEIYRLGLDPIAETRADPNSYGFRLYRSCADAIQQCRNALSQKKCARYVLDADIKSCFDKIDHDWLLANIPMDKAILKMWLKSGYFEKTIFYDTETGSPQGGIISPVLANMTLDGLEATIRSKYRSRRSKVNVIRYADDFVITGASEQILKNEILPMVEAFLKPRGLELSQEKTRITTIEEGFDFLGKTVKKFDDKLIIRPSKKNVSTFINKIKTILRKHRAIKTADLIDILNPKIRGWANYHRYENSSKTFKSIDSLIFNMVRKWANRRHKKDKKNHKWIDQHYFCKHKGRDWTFYGTKTGKDGLVETRWLYFAAHTRLRNHCKIKGQANPYDPEWKAYLEARKTRT